jgi:hypothetical protein
MTDRIPTQTLKIEEMTDDQLKSIAYDELMKITNAQRNYEMLKREITRRAEAGNGAVKE